MHAAEILVGLRDRKLDAGITLRPPAGAMSGLNFEPVRRYPAGVLCPLEHPWAKRASMRASRVRDQELVIYRAQEFPEYFEWICRVLRVRRTELRIRAECDDALGIVAAVESGRGVAVTGEFIAAIAGRRACFVTFAGDAHSLEVGLLYRRSAPTERMKMLIQAASEGTE